MVTDEGAFSDVDKAAVLVNEGILYICEDGMYREGVNTPVKICYQDIWGRGEEKEEEMRERKS